MFCFYLKAVGCSTDSLDAYTALEEKCAVTKEDKIAFRANALLSRPEFQELKKYQIAAQEDHNNLLELYAQLHGLDPEHSTHEQEWKMITAKNQGYNVLFFCSIYFDFDY